MKTLLSYLKPYRKECIISPLFKLLEALLELLVPLVVASMIDSGVALGDRGQVLRSGLLLVGLAALGFGCSVTAQRFAARAATGFAASLRGALFTRVQRFTYTELDAQGVPTLINRLTSDMTQVQTGVNMTLRLALRSPFVVLGAMIMAFTVNAKAALIFAALIPLLAVSVWLIMRLALPRHGRSQIKLDAALLRVRENLTGVRVLRAFNKQQDEIERFEADNSSLCEAQLGAGRVSALMNPITYTLVNLALVALLWQGAQGVQSGVMLSGAVVALVNYLSQILVELIKLANLIVTITKAAASAGRVGAVLDAPRSDIEPEQPVSADPQAPVSLKFSHVCARYNGIDEDALTDISFEVKRGQAFGVIGGTGSGKSTLVNLLPRFYDASAGTVEVCGVDVSKQSTKALRSLVRFVPQRAALVSGTIRENLLWGGRDASDEELWQALETAQAAEIVRNKPKGLDEPIEQNGRNLSGGQKQRLTIARALVGKPAVLVLDDSSSALDYATDAALRKALRGMQGGATVVIVSQRASAVRFADKILVLDDGKAVGLGTHDELMRSCPVYAEIYHTQYPKEAQ